MVQIAGEQAARLRILLLAGIMFATTMPAPNAVGDLWLLLDRVIVAEATGWLRMTLSVDTIFVILLQLNVFGMV
jgi:hypothetical protein